MRLQFLACLASAVLLLGFNPVAVSAAPASPEGDWIERAEALVVAARTHADAATFQREVQAHRERLREIVRAAGSAPPPQQRQLHVSMMLLNALLKSASDCHRAGRVTCPAELLRQLDAQVATARAQLKALNS
jgi:hypothetical protein